MSDRKTEDLAPEMQTVWNECAEEIKAASIDILVTCTLRTQAEQLELWKVGREFKDGKWIVVAPKKCITWTLSSKHLTGHAVDFVVMVNGKPDWLMVHKDLWDRVVSIGKAHGLSQVVGKDGRVKEFAHLQLGS